MNYDHEVFPTIRGVCVYVSDAGYLVIEQEGDGSDDEKSILVPQIYIDVFVKAIQAAVKDAK